MRKGGTSRRAKKKEKWKGGMEEGETKEVNRIKC
jgi:hypothetical protein